MIEEKDTSAEGQNEAANDQSAASPPTDGTKPESSPATPKAATAKKKTAKRKAAAKKNTAPSPVARVRRTHLFPASSFEEALTIPQAIQKHAAGQKIRRLKLFELIGKSPDSGTSRQWITNANKYGLLKGSYTADHLELTPKGAVASNNEGAPRDRLSARFELAIEGVAPFKALYESQKGNRLPANGVLEDIATENGIPAQNARECVETFIVNAKFLGLLKPIAGAERIIPLEQALEDLPRMSKTAALEIDGSSRDRDASGDENREYEMDSVCFYISPIGDEDSENRKHADLFLGSIVEPALEEFELKVVRADRIGRPGMITSQIIDYILRAKLVIADLSFHNPNVFYELALRHISRLPIVQIIRTGDGIPFDLDQVRTIQIDTTDIYTLVPKLQSYKAEIATQVRAALANPDSVDNPLSTYYPNLKVTF